MAAYPQIYWKLSTVKKICKRVDQTSSATERKAGSGRPKCARSYTNIAHVEELRFFPTSTELPAPEHPLISISVCRLL